MFVNAHSLAFVLKGHKMVCRLGTACSSFPTADFAFCTVVAPPKLVMTAASCEHV